MSYFFKFYPRKGHVIALQAIKKPAGTSPRRAAKITGGAGEGVSCCLFFFAAAPNRQVHRGSLRSETTRSWSYTGFMVPFLSPEQ